MICPYCKNEMRKGYIDKQRLGVPLEWYPANPLIATAKESIKLTKAFAGSIIAYRCEDCRKLIIDEDELKANM